MTAADGNGATAGAARYVVVFIEDPTVAANQDDQPDRLFRRLDHDRNYDACGTPNVDDFAQASFG